VEVDMIRKKLWPVLWIFVLMAGIGWVAWIHGEIMIDKCLDAGGAWDYQHKHCTFGKAT
jgi:hypothetical protein